MKLKIRIGRLNLELHIDKALVFAVLMLWC